jgi:hypothetical protein
LFFKGYLALPKTIKNIKKPQIIQLFSVSEGLSKTVKNHQKPFKSIQFFSFYEGYLAPPKTIKKRQKPFEKPVFVFVF